MGLKLYDKNLGLYFTSIPFVAILEGSRFHEQFSTTTMYLQGTLYVWISLLKQEVGYDA